MERIVRQTMLFDFYGELLTEHQRSAYEDVVMNDLSYAELARLQNISRQAAYDMIRRCDKQLEEYEEKLHLVERFLAIREEMKEIESAARELKEGSKDPKVLECAEQILQKAGAIIHEL
ncbi:MAG: YlxM family DNA-binding protein [Eubacterium sp.]|nr:YlxM family DNA-binding protein [Eubacterium sp.]